MFKYLKTLFKPKLDTLPKKLKFLKTKKFDIYKTILANREQLFIETTIEDYIYVMNKVITSNIVHERIEVKSISEHKIGRQPYSKWLSPNNYIVYDANERLHKWLNTAEEFYYIIDIGLNDRTSGIHYSNSRKLQPYIINIEGIVDDLLSIS